MNLPVIPHVVEGNIIQQRASDGYINATAMCKAAGKLFGHYYEAKATREYLKELSLDTDLPETDLLQVIKGGNPENQGSWVHPQVAIHLAQWLSPKFAVQVSKWVFEWMSGGAKGGAMAPHLQRYMVNRAEIPNTHFSMLNEMTFALIAPLEADGYSMPDSMIPDISEGKMFSQWLRKTKGMDPTTFPSYSHRYLDGRVVQARLYPNSVLADFRAHFHSVWLPTKSTEYLGQRDPKILPFLPKLLPKPS